jgi:hypothetical protein
MTGMMVIVGALVFATISHGTMSSPQYGAAYEYVEAPLDHFDGDLALRAARMEFLDDGASSKGVSAWWFADNPTIERQLRFRVVPPRWRRFGADSVPIAYVSAEDTTSCNYKVCVEFVLLEIGKAVPSVTAMECQVFATGGSTQPLQITMGSVPGVSTTLDPVLHGRIFRNNSHGDDTCDTKGLWLHSIGVAFQKDRPGSRTALSK